MFFGTEEVRKYKIFKKSCTCKSNPYSKKKI